MTLVILQLLWNYSPLATMFPLSLTSSCPTCLHTLCKFQSVIVFFLLPFVLMSCSCVTSLVKTQSSVDSILCICTHAGEWGQGKIGNQTDKLRFKSWWWTSNAHVPCFPSPFNLHFTRLFHTIPPQTPNTSSPIFILSWQLYFYFTEKKKKSNQKRTSRLLSSHRSIHILCLYNNYHRQTS